MKVWQVILLASLLAIILILGFAYVKILNNFDDLMLEKEKLLEEYNNQNITANDKDIFYEVVKNNALHYEIYDSNKSQKENVKIYMDALTEWGQIIPIFSNPNKLEKSYIERLLVKLALMQYDINLHTKRSGTIIHKDFVNIVLEDLFGDTYDASKIDLKDFPTYLAIQPFERYDDIYTIDYFWEVAEDYNNRYAIVDTIEKEETIEVTFIEYSLVDERIALYEGEKCKRMLVNNQGEKIKEYDIEGVNGLDDHVKMRNNGIVITYEDIEKYILNNRDKFENKKIVFDKKGWGIKIVSCEIVE